VLIENEENKEQFDNLNAFLEITVPVDFELFNEIFYENEDMLDDEDLEIREVFVQGEGKFYEQVRKNTVISSHKMAASSSLNRERFIEQLKYD
jgi:hypothetical protein